MEQEKPRNAILGAIQKSIPEKLKERTVAPPKGKGRKDRPRQKKGWDGDLAVSKTCKNVLNLN